MPETFLTTREVASHLHINEKQVYQLIRRGNVPCTRVTGKWLFPQSLIDDWVKRSARERMSARPSSVTERFGLDQGLLMAGSNDPLLDSALAHFRRRFPEILLYAANIGSLGGLEALHEGKAHVALAHLRDPKTGEYNVPYLSQYFSPGDVVAVSLWRRRIGFVQRHGSGPPVRSFSDRRLKKRRFINRQRGSGIRLLIDQSLQAADLKTSDLKGYETESWTHWEVGTRVARSQADVGIAAESVARLLGLTFHEIADERFDLIVRKDNYFSKPVQACLEVLRSGEVEAAARSLGGYDLRDCGKLAIQS